MKRSLTIKRASAGGRGRAFACPMFFTRTACQSPFKTAPGRLVNAQELFSWAHGFKSCAGVSALLGGRRYFFGDVPEKLPIPSPRAGRRQPGSTGGLGVTSTGVRGESSADCWGATDPTTRRHSDTIANSPAYAGLQDQEPFSWASAPLYDYHN